MAETVISVQGQHTAWFTAERATVVVSITFDGPHRNPVFSSATAALDAVRETVVGRHDAQSGPITWWSADTVRVWSERPWNTQGKQLDPVHHAALDLSARFSDFEALAAWIELVVAIPGTAISGIEWSLTDATRTSATTEVRSRAVKDAVAKASVYAQSIGLGSVTATAIADPGMLGDSASPNPMAMDRMMTKSAFTPGDSERLELKPEQIEITAAVDARFVAR
jgi:hypothetical protein